MKVEKLRIKIASDLHDEVGSLLTQISINTEVLPYLKVKKELDEKINLIREKSAQVIKIMSDVIWSIDSRNDTLESLVNRVNQFAFSFLKQKGMKLIFKNRIKNGGKKLKLEVRQNLMLIAKEAINNAVKYSGGTALEISFKENKRRLEMTIKDNGKGLPGETHERGNGLRNMKMRAELINAQIDFVNENGLKILLSLKI
jgi:signal transduction histidine kinase